MWAFMSLMQACASGASRVTESSRAERMAFMMGSRVSRGEDTPSTQRFPKPYTDSRASMADSPAAPPMGREMVPDGP